VQHVAGHIVLVLEGVGGLETVQVDSGVEGLEVLLVVGLGVEFEDFNVKKFNVFDDYLQGNFFAHGESFFVLLAELKLHLISILLEVTKRNLALIKGLHAILRQIHLPPLLNLLEMILLKVLVVLSQTSLIMLTEILQVLINQLVVVVILVRPHVAHVAAPVRSGLLRCFLLLQTVFLEILIIILHDADFMLVKHVDVVAEEGF